MVKYYSAGQFAFFRIIFGIYLAWHFYDLIPYASEMFGSNGMIPNPLKIPTWGIAMYLYPTQINVELFLPILITASIMFAAGFLRKIMALILWYGWTYFLNRNPFISNPGIPYVGWLLLACVLIPNGEGYYGWNISKIGKKKWFMPKTIYWGAWFLMTIGYTISGIHKLQCPSWIDGTAMYHILSSVLARDNFMVNTFLALPMIIIKFATWFSLAAEILFLPLGVFYHTRKWYWLIFITIHLGILCLINFTDLTLGVIMIHIFTFEYRWLHEFPFTLLTKKN
ncbi:hypothetical protein QJ857_gp0737 [Tupanvirus soda lake]|uniref:HTTM domain-containing protein n=2 Tax=Tupanvirus TaxID=2094720 RepID=A0A6N1P2R3_9VIRU|nr:hypothetical protein QJ857_gp0737 [Tupanvirus soda lake]QKU35311.1 hypothetical protein [Tupanvirus soda lake]